MNLKREVMSAKELALLGILIVLVIYFIVVQGPIKKQSQEYENKLAEINMELELAQQKAAKKVKMQKEIDAMFARYGENPPMTPEYNNINYIIGELNGILGNSYDYNLAFGEETVDASNVKIIRRPINISFSTQNYNDVVSKINMINKSTNKYLIQNVSVSDTYVERSGLAGQYGYRVDNSAGRYNVTMTMTSFEFDKEAKLKAKLDAEAKAKENAAAGV